jgi:hypothetical protein
LEEGRSKIEETLMMEFLARQTGWLARPARFALSSISALSPTRFPALPTAAVLAALLASSQAMAQDRPVPDSYEATTSNMTPAGVTLKIEVLHWSDESARDAVIAALNAESDVSAALTELPSAGVVWRSGSAVGHGLKYAHRETADNGEQRITVITNTRLDSYNLKPWTLASGEPTHERPYSVIELRVPANGAGSGSLSFAADIDIDSESHSVQIVSDAPTLLTDVKMLPKPYWASGG